MRRLKLKVEILRRHLLHRSQAIFPSEPGEHIPRFVVITTLEMGRKEIIYQVYIDANLCRDEYYSGSVIRINIHAYLRLFDVEAFAFLGTFDSAQNHLVHCASAI